MSFPGFDTPAYGTIGGNLPWSGAGGAAGAAMAGNSPQAVGAAYQSAYNNSLAMNQSNYSNIMAGYQQALARQTTAQQAIQAGYSGLYNSVLDTVKGWGASRANDINTASTRQLSSASQQLIDRGLGNTTIQSSVGRGIESDRQRQLTTLSDDQAQMQAGYMSNLGLAGLSSQQRGLDATTGTLRGQLDFMERVKAGYPDAGMYSSLAQQAAANRRPYAYGGGSFGGVGSPGPKVGYVPGGGPYYGGSADSGGYGGGGGGGGWLSSQYAAGAAAGAAAYGASGWGGEYGGYEDPSEVAIGGAMAGAGTDMSGYGDYGGGGDF